jgi:hypothetical protein
MFVLLISWIKLLINLPKFPTHFGSIYILCVY